MLKEIVGRIVDAELKAENIEKQARAEAEQILAHAVERAEFLKSHPAQDVVEQADKILQQAQVEAQKLASQRLESCNVDEIDAKKIDKAVQAIVAEFLKRGI